MDRRDTDKRFVSSWEVLLKAGCSFPNHDKNGLFPCKSGDSVILQNSFVFIFSSYFILSFIFCPNMQHSLVHIHIILIFNLIFLESFYYSCHFVSFTPLLKGHRWSIVLYIFLINWSFVARTTARQIYFHHRNTQCQYSEILQNAW